MAKNHQMKDKLHAQCELEQDNLIQMGTIKTKDKALAMGVSNCSKGKSKSKNYLVLVHIVCVICLSFDGFLPVLHQILFVSFTNAPRLFFRSNLSHGMISYWIFLSYRSIQSDLSYIFSGVPDKIELCIRQFIHHQRGKKWRLPTSC